LQSSNLDNILINYVMFLIGISKTLRWADSNRTSRFGRLVSRRR